MGAVAGFIGTGLSAGAACIEIATEPHCQKIVERLRAIGYDLAAARARGRYIALDAPETLARCMGDGMPDPAHFHEVVGSVVARVAEAAQGG